jgi:L-iditol 2-dehydrogenase
LTNLISHRFGLEDCQAAIELASNPKPDSMKIVLKPQGPPSPLVS